MLFFYHDFEMKPQIASSWVCTVPILQKMFESDDSALKHADLAKKSADSAKIKNQN